jgi:hypothetical protein
VVVSRDCSEFSTSKAIYRLDSFYFPSSFYCNNGPDYSAFIFFPRSAKGKREPRKSPKRIAGLFIVICEG